MQSVMSNIFNLLENFVDIIDNKYVLIIGVKYHSSNMNDAHTVSLTDIVSCPAKVIWLTTFFLNSKHLFIWLLCWPSASQLGHQLMKCI